MRYLKALLALVLLPSVCISGTDASTGSGYLILRLWDPYGPESVSPVFLTDTLGTRWNMIPDPWGEYNIGEYGISVPEGYYFLTTSGIVIYKTFKTDWMYIASGDTVYIEHMFERYDFGDDTWLEFHPDTLQLLRIYLKADNVASIDGLTVFTRERFFREERVSQKCYLVNVDNTCSDLRWNLPHLGDQTFSLPYNEIFRGNTPELVLHIEDPGVNDSAIVEQAIQNPLLLARSTNDEWVSPEYQISRALINPAEWGHEELYKYGYVDGRAYLDQSDNDETWRIVLVFHRKLVVLEEDTKPVIHDLDSSISRAEFSPLGRYLFFFDATEGMHCREEGIMLNTLTGEERRFIPDPYAEPYEFNPTFSSPWSFTPHWSYHPADDGTLISLFRDSIRLYNEQLEVTRTSYLEGMCIGDGYNSGIRQISSNGNSIAMIDYEDEECSFVVFNRDGSIESRMPVHLGLFRADIELTVLTSVSNFNGISVWDITDGSLLWHQDATQCGGNVISPEGNLIGWSPEWATCEIRSVQTGELQDSFPTGEPLDTVRIGYLGDDGTSIILLNGHHTYRFALRSSSGDLIWLSASRYRFPRIDAYIYSLSSIWDFMTLSADGETIIYNDGCFIHVLNFARISD